MNKKAIFKGLALINFLVLITVLLLYKNGTFDRHAPKAIDTVASNHDTGKPTLILSDSLPQERDSEFYARMSSSKSMIIVEPAKLSSSKPKIAVDTAKSRAITTKYKLTESPEK